MNQVVADDDSHLLNVLAIATIVVVTYHTAVTLIRSHLLLRLRTQLDVSMTVSFLEHLVDLPYAFFLKRSAGDLMMRMRSNATVREMLTSGAMSAVIDGGLASLYIIILLVVSPTLGVLAAVLGALQIAVLLVAKKPNARLMAESLQAEAKTQAYAYELLAGIETLKASGSELRSLERWTNLFVDEVNVSVRAGKVNALVDAAGGQTTFCSRHSRSWWSGPTWSCAGNSNWARCSRWPARRRLSRASPTLVSTGLQLQLLGSYLDRIDDVLDTPSEHGTTRYTRPPELTGDMHAEHITFR